MTHGFPASDWERARIAATEILTERAGRRAGQLITYGQLVSRLPIPLEPHDPRVSYLLDEISRSEHAQGRGFLTVLVVHAQGDTMPGEGFFAMARECGEEFDDELEFWTRALRDVTTTWRR